MAGRDGLNSTIGEGSSFEGKFYISGSLRIDGKFEGEIKTDERVFTDVDDRQAVRVGRWIPPGGSSYITVSYRLPDATFGTDGNLEYRAGVEHQLTINDVDLTVTVTGPSQPQPLEGDWAVDGNRATTHFAVTGPTTLALGFGDR